MLPSSSPSADRPLDEELLRRFLEASQRARILAHVNAAQSEPELADATVTELCEAYDAEIAIMLALPAGGGAPRILGSAGVAAAQQARLLTHVLPGGLLGRVPHVQLGADLLGLGARSLVSAPFPGGGGSRGAIVLACLDDRRFDDAQLALLEGVAENVGRALARLAHTAALEESGARMRAVFEQAPVAMLVASGELRVAEANAAACALLGTTRERAVALRLGDLVRARPNEAQDEPWRSLLARGEPAVVELVRPDGSRVEAEVTATASVFPGGHLIVVRDVGSTVGVVRAAGLAEPEPAVR